MAKYADLEIGLQRREAERYQIDLRFSRPDSDTEERLVRDGPLFARFDMARLRSFALDAEAYGTLLGESLFGAQEVRAAFDKACTVAQSLETPLRLRLFIDPNALELHSLRWETLRDPRDGTSLLTSEHLLFSRYLSSFDWRPVRLRPQAELRALVVIADPNDITDYQMAPLNEFRELDRAKFGLGDMHAATLASGGSATLKNMIATLRDAYDILYLIAHGKLVDDEPWLWLEDENEKTQLVSGRKFVTRLRELEKRPRLIVLASCQSAGTGDEAQEGALAALGPQLAEAGIPAVIAMQGNITIETIEEFMLEFFEELRSDGQIDRAMAVARGSVRERPDWWMPVLYMRLKSGKIWYVPGFAEEQQGLEKWPALLSGIRNKHCTPILGPGLSEPLLGSRRELAWRWAETYHFPMAPHEREDLPQVAQYLAINQSPKFLQDNLIEYVRQYLLDRYESDLPDNLQKTPLHDLLKVVGAQRRERDPADPYRVLAELPFSIYVITTPGNLLEEALLAAGKEPRVELCRWNDYVESPSVYDEEPDYKPGEKRPLVYHLFGSLKDPDSLILTEDDYFDYLIGVTRNNDLIPRAVRRALTDAALLFLGFQMDDWNFRVLFRSIMSREGGRRRRRYAHIAAQINPEEGRILEPERARRYLEEYFDDADISIYWGSAEDFVRDLQRQWKGGAT
ncbi:MAG: CHAT domain-containing protein [bacterium]|nr:CHAT domain-containing protein [bacterium]